MSVYPLDHLRSLPDGSLSATEVHLLCDEIERLTEDRQRLAQLCADAGVSTEVIRAATTDPPEDST